MYVCGFVGTLTKDEVTIRKYELKKKEEERRMKIKTCRSCPVFIIVENRQKKSYKIIVDPQRYRIMELDRDIDAIRRRENEQKKIKTENKLQ